MSGQGPFNFATMPGLVMRVVGGRARGVALVVVIVVIATASSCGGGGARSQKVAKPVITPKQAASVVMKLDRENVKAIEGLDQNALPSIDADPQKTIDENSIQTVKALNTTVTAYPYVSVTPLVPKQTAFPAWFLAVTKDAQAYTGLGLYTRKSLRSGWKLALVTQLKSGPIQWKKASGGWAVSANLNVNLSQTLADYWGAATSGGDAQAAGVAPGSMTSDIASGLNSDDASNERDGWAVGLAFSAGGTLPEAIKLVDGGALGFAWVTELLKTRPSIAPCFPQPETNGSKWDPQVPNGNYQELALTYTYLEGMVEPPTGDLSAASYQESTTGVSGTACPG